MSLCWLRFNIYANYRFAVLKQFTPYNICNGSVVFGGELLQGFLFGFCEPNQNLLFLVVVMSCVIGECELDVSVKTLVKPFHGS